MKNWKRSADKLKLADRDGLLFSYQRAFLKVKQVCWSVYNVRNSIVM